MPLNNQALSQKTTIYSLLKAMKDTINYNMNCVKVATVVEFNPELLTVKCRVNNKRQKQLNTQGNQIIENYPDVFAKVHFFGWGDVGSVYPIEPGMEGLLLFNDRELESWFLTGENEKLAYDRCHDLSDALFICGLHSQPKIPLVPYLEACLHIYYKNSDIQIRDESIIVNTKDCTLNTQNNTLIATSNNITATTNHTGTLTATQLNDTTAASGTFESADGKIITVANGIIRRIS